MLNIALCTLKIWRDILNQENREGYMENITFNVGLDTFYFFLFFYIVLFFFLIFFIFKLYIIVLVLPNIKMNPPQVYMCSPS